MELSESARSDISKIKKKYHFYDDADLLERIEHLPTSVALMSSITRPGTIKKQTKALIKALKNLLDTLRETSLQTKINIDGTIQYYENLGYKNIRSQNRTWFISTYATDTYIAYQACLFTLENIPADPGGPTQQSTTKYIIFLLTPIYHAGTGNEPTCGWIDSGDDNHSGKHIGDFYEFVLDLLPVLSELKINLGN